jgi:hypothetical protein
MREEEVKRRRRRGWSMLGDVKNGSGDGRWEMRVEMLRFLLRWTIGSAVQSCNT